MKFSKEKLLILKIKSNYSLFGMKNGELFPFT